METKIYEEIIATIEETDVDVRFAWGDRHEYWVKTQKGKAYPIIYRCERASGKHVEKVLDVNEVAAEMKYCSLGGFKP